MLETVLLAVIAGLAIFGGCMMASANSKFTADRILNLEKEVFGAPKKPNYTKVHLQMNVFELVDGKLRTDIELDNIYVLNFNSFLKQLMFCSFDDMSVVGVRTVEDGVFAHGSRVQLTLDYDQDEPAIADSWIQRMETEINNQIVDCDMAVRMTGYWCE